MEWAGIVFIIFLAFIIAALFAYPYGTGVRWTGGIPLLILFFILIWLAAWASALWFAPVGPVLWGIPQIPVLVVAWLVALFWGALIPSRPGELTTTGEATPTRTKEKLSLGLRIFSGLRRQCCSCPDCRLRLVH